MGGYVMQFGEYDSDTTEEGSPSKSRKGCLCRFRLPLFQRKKDRQVTSATRRTDENESDERKKKKTGEKGQQ